MSAPLSLYLSRIAKDIYMTIKVLVADDSITIQKIVAMAFEGEDAIVQGVSNGNDAFDRLEDFQPDVVLADVDLTGLTGYKLSRKIKESAEFPSIRVLLLASDFEEFDEEHFANSKAEGHISKPFKSDDIVNRVKELLKGAPAEDAASPSEPVEDEVISLSAEDMVGEPEEETALELSASDLIGEPEEGVFTGFDEKDDAVFSLDVPASTEEEDQPEQDMVLDELERMAPANAGDTGEVSAVIPREEEPAEKLHPKFMSVVNQTAKSTASEIIKPVETIVPEPENLLGNLENSALDFLKSSSRPDVIRESLSYLADLSGDGKNLETQIPHKGERLQEIVDTIVPSDDRIVQMVDENVRRVLGETLDSAVEKELARLSATIVRSVKEVVKEIAPGIAREVIKEEIDKIKMEV